VKLSGKILANPERRPLFGAQKKFGEVHPCPRGKPINEIQTLNKSIVAKVMYNVKVKCIYFNTISFVYRYSFKKYGSTPKQNES